MTVNRLRRGLTLLLGFYFALDALWMLADPTGWYYRAGVAFTGPANVHFIRDLGCAFLVSAVSLLWFAKFPRAWPAALAGVSFLVLHVFVHVWDTMAGRETYHHLFAHELLIKTKADVKALSPALYKDLYFGKHAKLFRARVDEIQRRGK